ncbi:MAG: sigma-70 factor domain-containing protein, partial [Chloroflexota bacterium]
MIQELLDRAEQRGYLTFDDVLDVLEDEDSDDIGTIEAILYELDDLGIELQKEGTDISLEDDEDENETRSQKPLKDPNASDIGAISSDDPVGLYFRQMAQEPLLTAEEEIDLAKRIERGCKAQERVDRDDANQKSRRWHQSMQRLIFDGQLAREHLGRANTRLVVSIA